jgi:signal recognition particle receptor subunit beta
MVFFNYATMQMAAKIVYYGPGLCGKTTNLHHIYSKTSPQSRGEMVSLETETDRTLFFDLLPIDVGVIGGFKTRLQLYTVPGQVFYNTTRKLVLKGVDGIVFVADSQKAMLEANVESLKNLRENLAEIGTNLDEIPVVLQLNKRDLPNIAPVETMLEALDPEHRSEHVESVASTGVGVFETLKLISKLTLRTLRRRMTGDEPSRPAAPARSAQFRVQDPSRTMAGTIAVPPTPAPAPVQAVAAQRVEAPTAVEERAPAAAMPVEHFDADATVAVGFDRRVIADAPIADAPPVDVAAESMPEPPPPPPADEHLPTPAIEARVEMPEPIEEASPAPPEVIAEAPIVAEPEIAFSETEKAQKVEPEVKTVKVRSSVDVMAELEALRKRATNTTPKAPKRDVVADLDSLRPKRDLNRTLHLQLPSALMGRTKSVRVTLAFEDGAQEVIDTQDQHLELGDTSDVQSLSVNLKIDLG